MTRKQIDASREARLWLSQIVIPAAGIVMTALTIPEVRQTAVNKYYDAKSSIQKKFKKKES